MTRFRKSTPMPNKSYKSVLAIDPGFDRMGVAILEGIKGKESVLFSECISTSVRDKHGVRLRQIGNRVSEIIRDWKPDELAIEKLFFNQNAQSAMGVAEARGVALYEAANVGLAIFEYSPQDVKIAVTGYGRANKGDVFTMVKRLITFHKDNCLDDEIDAIAIGLTHFAHQSIRDIHR